VSLENVLRWILSSIEVVYVDEVNEHACKEMTTVRENYFMTTLDGNVLILSDGVREYIHHPDAIEETHNDLETSWVEGHANRFFLELLIYLKLEAEGWVVAPYFDRIIRGACSDQILLDTDIHTGDGPRMETMPEIVVASLHIFVVH